MTGATSPFLFASADWRVPSTARKVHLRRVHDILRLSIQRGDLPVARRAFGLLARCKEVHWTDMWKTGMLLLSSKQPEEVRASAYVALFWRGAYPPPQCSLLTAPAFQRETLVQELVLSLAVGGQEREALDELELYLPSPPYQDNSVLHTYAGLLCLRLASHAGDDSRCDMQGTYRAP
ncbi:hypothetical protein BC834DRAFT_821528 [Gloeopeniophorella convolvens]|nr:hypothetical protein BC834DRAFT_821528 [Gloeopeniophorella convolvens]